MTTEASEKHEKTVTIIVNGREKEVEAKELSFDEIVDLGFDDPQRGEYIVFTITYRRGPDEKKEGTLLEGETVKVKDGMIFNVTRTDKS